MSVLSWYRNNAHPQTISYVLLPEALYGGSDSWINEQTAHCVSDVSHCKWPIAIDNPNPGLTGVQNPFGTYLKQNINILIHTNNASGNTFEKENGRQINSLDFNREGELNFGYGNGFTASYSIEEGSPGVDDQLVVSLTFTSTQDNNISNTQYIYFESNTSNIY